MTPGREEFDVLRGRYVAFTQSIIDGGYLVAREQVGGFFLIEAHDLNEAIQIASRIPDARTGGIEVRPVVEFSQRRTQLPGQGRTQSRLITSNDRVTFPLSLPKDRQGSGPHR